jgi:hypothetical protein
MELILLAVPRAETSLRLVRFSGLGTQPSAGTRVYNA